MQRRNLLQLLALPSAGAMGLAAIGNAWGQTGTYGGRILVSILANRALDQSSWVDPRETDGKMNVYAAEKRPAGVAGRIRYAPMGDNKFFFDKYHRQMLVINGVHSETNSHPLGVQVNATGSFAGGFPQLAELFAKANGPLLPFSRLQSPDFVFKGGGGLVPATAMPSLDTWRLMGNPNAVSSSMDLMNAGDVNHIQAARLARLKTLQEQADALPRMNDSLRQYTEALKSKGLLQRTGALTSLDSFQEAHISLLAAQAGLTTSIQLSIGNFDMHRDLHRRYNAGRLRELVRVIDYIWEKSKALGMADRIFMRIYSDFGRTPYINSGNGKDHWAIGSQILMEANPTWGNRVFGASGPQHQPVRIKPQSGQVDEQGGKLIRARHVHTAIRSYLGLNPISTKYDLRIPADENFAFFDASASTGYPHL